MTGDDLISMHKATVRVIEDMTNMDMEDSTPSSRVMMLRDSIKALAVVQRDILAGTLKAVLGEGP